MSRLAGLGLLLLLARSGDAVARSPEVHVSGGDSLTVWVLVDWDRPLPPFVEERLQRGIPATVGVRVELWRDRIGWFDSHLASAGREMKVLRDPWREAFSILEGGSSSGVDSLSALQSILSKQRVRLTLDPGWCDSSSSYQIVATTYVRPLTASDVGEVETWLRGEIRGIGGGLLGVPRGLFSVVRDLSGLGEQTSRGSSPRFGLSTLPDGRVRVLVPGASSAKHSEADGHGLAARRSLGDS